MIENEQRSKSFTASNMYRLISGGTGATRDSYILEVALTQLGIRDEFDTKEMKHGTANQFDAFQFAVKPIYKDSIWFDEYVPINDKCGASPDIKIDDETPCDVKCPYYIDTYLSQKTKAPNNYYVQVQTQIMALKGEYGLLCIYLTKPMEWGAETVIEYPFELSDRFHIHEFRKDLEMEDKILKAVEENYPRKERLVEMLQNAEQMDEMEYFYTQLKGGMKLRPIKQASNMWNLSKIIRVGDNFYYEVR